MLPLMHRYNSGARQVSTIGMVATMNSPERPRRPMLLAGVGFFFIGAGLIAARFGTVLNILGFVLEVVAAVIIVKSMGWKFTRRS